MVKKILAKQAKKQLMEETVSLCPVCLDRIPAKKIAKGSRVYLEKSCKKHGDFSTLIWQGKPEFSSWRQNEQNDKPRFTDTKSELGCPYDCGICDQHKQEICCVLINLTERCNQHCEFCFASSGETPKNPDISMAEIENIYDSLIAKNRDNPYNIQLSGGEPTMREELPEIIAMGKTKGFHYIQLNTNGKKLGQNPEYAKKLAAAGLDCAYLQFDGTNDSINEKIRGEKLLDIKTKAIENCAAAGIGVVLVITVVPDTNYDNIGSIIDFAIKMIPKVRGVSLQPVSYFGRFPEAPTDQMRITIPQIIQAIEKQTNRRFKAENFLPLVSGDCFCS
ncbi:MAG: radical SAM protein, partial [Bacillota bacterium]